MRKETQTFEKNYKKIKNTIQHVFIHTKQFMSFTLQITFLNDTISFNFVKWLEQGKVSAHTFKMIKLSLTQGINK